MKIDTENPDPDRDVICFYHCGIIPTFLVTGEAKIMKKLVALLMAGTLFLLGCVHQQNLTEEEKEAYRKAKMRYDAGQRSGP